MASTADIPSTTDLIPGVYAEVPATAMRVRTRNGSFEQVTVEKIIRAVERSAVGPAHVDPMRVAIKTIGRLYDGSTTKELDSLSIHTAASLIAEEPEYSRLAARILTRFTDQKFRTRTFFRFRNRSKSVSGQA